MSARAKHKLGVILGSACPSAGNAHVTAYEAKHPGYQQDIIPLVSDTFEIGLEIEIERVKANKIGQYLVWQQRPDGSLRDNGVEFVSIPIAGPRIAYALNQFFDLIPRGYRFSHRTSIHVHQNCLDMTLEEIASECLLYSVFEKVLFKFIGGDRDKNNFCVPWHDALPYQYIALLLGGDIPQLEQYRYLALNPDALRKFGTLEYRHMGGTDDKVRIMKWINVIFCLKAFAMKHSFADLHARINALNTNSAYDAFFTEVFGVHASTLDQWSLRRDMEVPISSCKNVVGSKDFWAKLRALNHRESYWYKRLVAEKKVAPQMTFDLGTVPRPRPRAPRAGAVPPAQRARVEMRAAEEREMDAILNGRPVAVVGDTWFNPAVLPNNPFDTADDILED
jgi:hypothetical protein